jgi:hypothetical protein
MLEHSLNSPKTAACENRGLFRGLRGQRVIYRGVRKRDATPGSVNSVPRHSGENEDCGQNSDFANQQRILSHSRHSNTSPNRIIEHDESYKYSMRSAVKRESASGRGTGLKMTFAN